MPAMKPLLGILMVMAAFASAEGLLYLPISGDVGKTEDMATVNRLYHEVVESQFKGKVIADPESGEPCGVRDCAVKAAQKAKADRVIYSTFSRLGSKWVFNSTLVNADGSDAFTQRLTALSIEDMEAVTHRMAEALLNHKSTEQVASMDNLTEKEETQEPLRRRSRWSTGLAAGYLFPTGSGAFDSSSQFIRLSWVANWELRNDLILNGEIDLGFANQGTFGGDLNLDYIFTRNDYSPFVGGGLGLHIVGGEDGADDGPAFNVQGGMLLFRTYDLHVMVRAEYQVILNGKADQGLIVNVSITY